MLSVKSHGRATPFVIFSRWGSHDATPFVIFIMGVAWGKMLTC
jgi:hypothetical protein